MPLFGKKSVEPSSQQRRRIYSEDEIKERLESMDPDMQNTFIRLAEILMHKESQMFLDIVAKSRQDIKEVGDSIREEQEVLKTTAKILARERSGVDGLEYADVNEDESQTKVHFESEYNKKVVQDYLKAVGRDVPTRGNEMQKRRNYKLANTDAGYVPEYARRVGAAGTSADRPFTAGSATSRPGTAYRMRMGQKDSEEGAVGGAGATAASWDAVTTRQRERTMEEDAKVKEEKEELMEQMKMMDNMMLGEKARQQEAMQARKEARKARKEQKKADEETQAMELLETNQEAEEQKRKSKERQEQMLKERLAKKRLERRKTLQDMQGTEETPVEATAGHVPAGELAQELERELGITRAKTSVQEPAAEQPKKKGKKKKQEADTPAAPVEAQWDVGDEVGKMSAKKRQPKLADEPAAAVAVATEAAGDGKKKKKKKTAAVEAPTPDDTVLNIEVGDGATGGGRKKRGKKKLSNDMDLTVSEV